MKKDEMKEIIKNIGFEFYFDHIVWISSKQQYFITTNIGPRVANWPSNLISILFRPWGQSQGHKVINFLKKSFSFSALTPIVKPLGLISVIEPIGMLDLSSTLAWTPMG